MEHLNLSGSMHEYEVSYNQVTGYAGVLEVFHQLHCLNLIRQYTWVLEDAYSEELMPPDMRGVPAADLRDHADHCIESLRLTLMCHGDVSPVLVKINHKPDPPIEEADFNVHHVCRNFDKLVAWNQEHAVRIQISGHGNHSHHHGS
ncbi:hypothetical protein ANO11243_055570 [Dothideomycetidae sp. 11243]|nr:hypothetical protein ANO11243_055570 [fungal sp. No.11243]